MEQEQQVAQSDLPPPNTETRRQNFAVNDGYTTARNDNPEGLAWLVEQ